MIGLIAGLWGMVEVLGLTLARTIVIYFAWNHLAPIYFNFLQEKWMSLPFWHVFGLLIICTFISTLCPKIIEINQTNK